MQFEFGIGNLYAVRNDVTPIRPIAFGNIQDVSFDFSFEAKELYGQQQFPLAVARAKAKITGKAKIAKINGSIFNELFFGGTYAAGQTQINASFASAVPTTPFQVTIAPPSSGTFADDLGVSFASSGIPLTRVASAPTTGQYSVAGAVYTFAAADTGLAILISYSYTVAAVGSTISYANQLMGAAPQFAIEWGVTYQGKAWFLKLNSCISTKFTMPMKLDDFVIPELDFSAFADASGNILTLSGAE